MNRNNVLLFAFTTLFSVSALAEDLTRVELVDEALYSPALAEEFCSSVSNSYPIQEDWHFYVPEEQRFSYKIQIPKTDCAEIPARVVRKTWVQLGSQEFVKELRVQSEINNVVCTNHSQEKFL